MSTITNTGRIIPQSTEDKGKITEPPYYHRNYSNDIPKDKKTEKGSWVNTAQRVGMTALPFLSLYKPLSFPISLGMGGLRTYTCASQLIASIRSGNTDQIPYQLLQTTIAVIALAGTIFAHPIGMLISTGHDLIMDVVRLIDHLQKGEYQQAMECCFSIISNALYLSLFLHGGLELAIASLAVQILLGLYNSRAEFMKGNYIEAVGHIGMALVRGNQLAGQAKMLQTKLAMQELLNRAKNQRNQEVGDDQPKKLKAANLVTNEHVIQKKDNGLDKNSNVNPCIKPRGMLDVTKLSLEERVNNYLANPWGWPALHYALEMKDEEAALFILKANPNQAKMFTPDLPIMDFHFGDNADKDYDFKIGTEAGISAVELAVRHNCSISLLTQLIDAGADFQHRRKEFPGPVRNEWETKTGYFKERNKMIGRDPSYIFTPLYWAIVNENKDVIKFLIDKGCNIDECVYERITKAVKTVTYTTSPGYGTVVGWKVIHKIERYTARELLDKTAVPTYEEIICGDINGGYPWDEYH